MADVNPPIPESTGRLVARVGLILFYGVAGIMHVVATEAMVRIVPGWVPMGHAVVIATGLCEIAAALALSLPARFLGWRKVAGWSLAAYALCVWPANFVHAIHDLGTGTGLSGWYHYPRLALQPLIIWWALWGSGAAGGARCAPPVG
jgi:uncharacterized membrane protein